MVFFLRPSEGTGFGSAAAPPVCDSAIVNLSFFFYVFVVKLCTFSSKKKLMKKQDKRECVSNRPCLLAPPPFLLPSRCQVAFTVSAKNQGDPPLLPEAPGRCVNPHITSSFRLRDGASLPQQCVYSPFSVSRVSQCFLFLFKVIRFFLKGAEPVGLQLNVRNKLQNCKRTNVSGSEDAHPPRRWWCNSDNWFLRGNAGKHFQNKRLIEKVTQKNKR